MVKRVLTSLMVLMICVSLVSAAIDGVDFVTPQSSDYISGNPYVVEWTNVNGYPGMYLQYRAGGCGTDAWNTLLGPFDETVLTYNLDTTSLADDEYCLRIFDLNEEERSGEFTIDNTVPTANAGGDYYCNANTNITLDGSGSTDNYGIALYEWDIGFGWQNLGANPTYTCGAVDTTVDLRVTDNAGNTDTDVGANVLINDVPVCGAITAQGDAAVDEQVAFSVSPADTRPVPNTLTYEWTANGVSIGSADNINYTFSSSPGNYEINVTVTDSLGLSCVATTTIDVVDPIQLADQEVLVGNNFVYSFDTALANLNCVINEGPAAMTDGETGTNCDLTWNNVPNADNGIHTVIIRAEDTVASTYKYYTVDVYAYSWMINLAEGWNLFSIPLVPESSDVDDVVITPLYNSLPGGTEYVLWGYKDGEWLRSRRSSSYRTLDEIEPGRAYWIQMAQADTLKGFGERFEVAQTPPSVKVSNGWNLLGHYGVNNAVSLANVFDESIGSANLGPVMDDQGNIVNTMDAGEGYWVAFNQNNGLTEMEYYPSTTSYTFL